MAKVTCEMRNGVLEYFVESDDGAKVGSFDCERSAQNFADYLNGGKDGQSEIKGHSGAGRLRKKGPRMDSVD